jgi:hypothetical protein
MAAKSVIEIDVNDQKFKTFQQAFEKYQKILEEQSKKWDQTNKMFDQLVKKQREFAKSVNDGNKALKDAAFITGGIARNMASIAISATKWLAFSSIASGFGFGSLAGSASSSRRLSQGIGSSIGQIRAAEFAYNRYFDATSVLNKIADIQQDTTKAQILTRFGAKPGQNPTEVLPEIIEGMVKAFSPYKDTPIAKQIADSLGLTEVFDLNTLRALSSLSPEERARQATKARNTTGLGLSPENSEAWQNFYDNLKKSGTLIETSLINNLIKLEPKLDAMRENITKVITSLVEKFGEYLSTPKFEEDVKKFVEAVEALGRATIKAAKFLGLLDKTEEEKAKETKNASDINVLRSDLQRDINNPTSKWWEGVKNRPFISDGRSLAERNMNPGNLRFVGQSGASQGEGNFAKFGSWKEGFEALNYQLMLYGTGKSKVTGGKKLTTLEDILPVYAPKSDKNDVEAYIKRVSRETGFGRSDQLNFQDPNTLFRLMAAITNVETGKQSFTPQGVQVIINNQTGGNSTVTSSVGAK